MESDRRIGELKLTSQEQSTIRGAFRAGKTHPWSDRLVDEAMDLIDDVAFNYLIAKRDSKAIERFVPAIKNLLDNVLLERLESARCADSDVRENPPYHTADRWPRNELPTVEKIMKWAFGDRLTRP